MASFSATFTFVKVVEKNETHFVLSTLLKGTAVTQWLRCCATTRKFAGSIPDGVIGIFR